MILRNNNLDLLCEALGEVQINFFNPEEQYELIHRLSIDQIQIQSGELTKIPPFEKHPYLENINCETTKGLMIGTFPPISYLCDQLGFPKLTFNGNINPPDLSYFHGNFSSLWKYCPINFENIKEFNRDEQPKLIKTALQKRGIVYTDIISYCQRELRQKKGVGSYTAEDQLLNNIVINNAVFPLILNCPNLDRVYFTNASFFGSDNRNNYLFDRNGNYILDDRDAFRLFLKGANDSGYIIDIAKNEEPDFWHNVNEGQRTNFERRCINKLFTTKIILKMRLSIDDKSKILQLYSSVSPAAVNRGMVRQNRCVKNFRENLNIKEEDAPKELLKSVLLSFFDNSIDGLMAFNSDSE
jgi:hypothetical protein